MPSSYPHNISPLLSRIIAFNPKIVLDVGTGYGKWAFLMREYLDNFGDGRIIDGVEAFMPYLGSSEAERYYDWFYAGDFLDLEFRLDHGRDDGYDLVLMIDVLEHFTEDNGRLAIEKALALSPTLMISTPLNYPQGAVNGNEHEVHRSEWRPADLEESGRWTDFSDERSTMGFLTR